MKYLKFEDFKVGMLVLTSDGDLSYIAAVDEDKIYTTSRPLLPSHWRTNWSSREIGEMNDGNDGFVEFKPSYNSGLADTPKEVRCNHCARRVFENDAVCWCCETKNPGKS